MHLHASYRVMYQYTWNHDKIVAITRQHSQYTNLLTE